MTSTNNKTLLQLLLVVVTVVLTALITTTTTVDAFGVSSSSTTTPSRAFASSRPTSSLGVSSTSASTDTTTTAASSSTTTGELLYNKFNDVVDDNLPLGKKVTHSHCKDPGDRDILVRAALGQETERSPVWMMRQAGRYMEAFREYSDNIPFRERSETPDYAVELSLQCHRAYGMDGIIMFSDILTPLPCLGIDFDVVKGVGPVISTKIRSESDVNNLPNHSFEDKVSFTGETLRRLSKEAEIANTSLIGFVGAPFTLAAYTIEGKSSKDCALTKSLMLDDEAGSNQCMSLFINKLAKMIGNYANYQIENGAEIIQIFESWAHQLSPANFEKYAKPAVMDVIKTIREKHPDVPVIYFANGGSSFLEKQNDMDGVGICLDWHVDMEQARDILGPKVPVSGNIDPSILKFGTKEQIEAAVRECIDKAGGPGHNGHIVNLGHGVMQGTPECNVKYLVDECKRYTKDAAATRA